ncbi:MAG: hypothetical protein ACLU0O_07855 [Collinsella sp.]
MVTGILAMLATIADMFRDTVGFSCNPIYLVHVLGHIAFFCCSVMLGDYLIDRFLAGRKSAVDVPRQVQLDGLTTCATWRSLASPDVRIRWYRKLGAIIYACWSPLLVLLFPGVIWWDTRQQLCSTTAYPMPYRMVSSPTTIQYSIPICTDGLPTWAVHWEALMLGCTPSAGTGVSDGVCLGVLPCFGTPHGRRTWRLPGTAGVSVPVLAPSHLCSAMAKDATFLPFFLLFSVASIEVMRSGATPEAPGYLAVTLRFCFGSLTRKTGLILVLIVWLSCSLG